jgi:Zn-finger nucleic acid-binding protein
VSLCPACHGILLSPQALRGIERRQELPPTVLSEQAAAIRDGAARISCPRCFAPMQREQAPSGLDFAIDLCRSCSLLWLDPGEIEAIQLAFEQSPTGQDMLRRQQDLLTLSDERRAALEANIAKAPDRKPVEMNPRHRYHPGRHGGISHLVVNSLFALFFRH